MKSLIKKIGGSLGRFYFAKLTLPLSRRPSKMSEYPISVHMLLSGRFMTEGIIALRSFEYVTNRRWEIVFHDDGRLAPHDVEKLRRCFPGCRVILRSEADAIVSEHLRFHPACLKERQRTAPEQERIPLICKFFDPLLFAPHRRYILLDSDVIFYRRPDEFLAWAEADDDSSWFNRDWEECASVEPDVLDRVIGKPFWRYVNGGICLINKDALCLDFTERILAEFGETARWPAMWDQTLYAIHASKLGSGGLLPGTYEISHNFWKRADTIARHYVGYQKYDQLFIEGAFELTRRMTIPQALSHCCSEN